MHALPFLLALAGAAVLAPSLLRTLADGGHVKVNYRGRALPFPFGVLDARRRAAGADPADAARRARLGRSVPPRDLARGRLCARRARARADRRHARRAGAGRPRGTPAAPRGWRGHGSAVLRGELSTGALKAAGSLGLALLAMSWLGLSDGRWLLAAGVLVLATNAFNLLDLRPGRSIKAFVLLGARPDDRRGRARAAVDARPVRRAGARRRRCTTCASGRCSATPARTCSGRSPACGSC